MLLYTTVPVERLSTGAVMTKYKEQVTVEQTIDFIKSPVQTVDVVVFAAVGWPA